ncbi:MAG: hypothetical protein C4348_02065 [Patescibacteria group bacterium]
MPLLGPMRSKKFFLLGAIIILIILLITGFGYYSSLKKPEEKKPTIVEAPEQETKPQPINTETPVFPTLPTEKPTETEEIPETFIPTSTSESKIKKLFDKELAYGDLYYPYIYIYDPQEGILKYLNLEDKTYKEIYKSSNISNISVSPTRKRIVFVENNRLNLLDLSKDSFINFKEKISSFIWKNDELYFFAFDNLNGGFVGKFFDLNKEPLILEKLNFIRAKLEIFGNLLLVYADSLNSINSPVFALNLSKPAGFSLYLEPKNYYSLISSNDGKYLFVSYQEDSWKSKIIDQNKKELIAFDWGTLKEKCSFVDVLVCGVPLNQKTDINDWYKLKRSYQDKIIIFNPKTKELKEVNLDGFFDVIKPKLTPIGIVFWNRNDANFYIVNLE